MTVKRHILSSGSGV